MVEQAVCKKLQQRAFTGLGHGSFCQFLAGAGANVADVAWLGGSSVSEHVDSSPVQGSLDEATVLQWIERELTDNADSVAELERDFCASFDLPSFDAAGCGSFFEFLQRNPPIGQLIAYRLGWRSSSFVLRPEDMSEFARQCAASHVELTASDLESCVIDHFGHTLHDLQMPDATLFLAQQAHDGACSKRTRYLGAVPNSNHNGSGAEAGSAVGQCGLMERRVVVEALSNAHMLAPLESVLLWRLIFEPEHGPLTLFLSSCAEDELPEEFCVLQLEPNLHVRIDVSAEVTAAGFRDAVAIGDVFRSVVVLTSILATSGSSQEQLLKTYAGQSFHALQTQKDGHAAVFVFECLRAMPSHKLRTRLSDVFLEPLAKLVPNYATLMLEHCSTAAKFKMLHELGFAIGNDVWTQDFRQQMLHPSTASTKKSTPTHTMPLQLQPQPAVESLNSENNRKAEPDQVELSDGYVEISTEANSQTKDTEADSSPPAADMESADNDEEIEAIRVIEDIRKNPELYSKMLARSLEKLSIELYSKDTHFVLELIQNADDNSYVDSVIPSAAFSISSSGMLIQNNEIGFTEQNIRAICDIGSSTKGTGGAGFIGQKGIGFKAVFKVTDEPAIRSRGYRICFRKNMVLPHLCDRQKKWTFEDEQFEEEEMTDWTTTIMLPFKSDVLDSGETISQMFSAIRPSLLLFLNKLRKLTVQNVLTLEERHMSREDDEEGIVRISHDDGVDTYLVCAAILPVEIGLRGDTTKTKLACAFPANDGTSGVHQESVYAFLPVASYGFRFIVQGDFIVSSSREAIRRDSGWNQFLLSALPKLFMSSLDEFKRRDALSDPLFNINRWFQYVPQQGEIRDFFKPIVPQIWKLLRGTKCVPTAKKFMLPSSVILCTDISIRHLIPDVQLSKLLGLNYAREDFVAHDSLAKALGLHSFNREYLFKYLEAFVKQMEGPVDAEYVQWVAKLIHCLYRLDGSVHSRANIKSIKFMPLHSGERGCLKDKLFFPLDKTVPIAVQNAVSEFMEELPIINMDLITCLSGIQNSVVLNSLRKFGVEALSLSGIVSAHILPQFAQATTLSTLESKPVASLHAYWSCLRMLYDKSNDSDKQSLVDTLRQSPSVVIPAKLKDHPDVILKAPNQCHFPPGFGNTSVVDPGWTFVVESLVEKRKDKHLIKSWKSFLSQLGVCDFVRVEHAQHEVQKGDLERTLGAAERWVDLEGTAAGLNNGIGSVLYVEKSSPELSTMVEALVSTSAPRKDRGRDCTPETCKKLQEILRSLNSDWTSHYKVAALTEIGAAGTLNSPDYSKPNWCRRMRSELGLFLRSAMWLPAVAPSTQSPSSELQVSTAIYSACDVWEDTAQLRSLLHVHEPYLEAGVCTTDFVKALGVASAIQPHQLLTCMQRWADPARTRFRTSIQHMARVYEYLWDAIRDPDDARNVGMFFANQPCIFIPFNPEASPDEDTDGQFYRCSECSWADPSKVMDMLGHRVLTRHYSFFRTKNCPNGLHDFFARIVCDSCLYTQKFGCIGTAGCIGCQDVGISNGCELGAVKNVPSVADYINAMESVATSSSSSDEAAADAVNTKILPILTMLAKMDYLVSPDYLETWKPQFFGKRIWPIQQAPYFVELSELIHNDNAALAERFAHEEGVCFLHLNAFDVEHVAPLLELLGVPRVSELVETNSVQGMLHSGTDIEDTVAAMIRYAQLYLVRGPLVFSIVNQFCMGVLYGRARRLTG